MGSFPGARGMPACPGRSQWAHLPPSPDPASFLKAQRRGSWEPRGERPQPRSPVFPPDLASASAGDSHQLASRHHLHLHPLKVTEEGWGSSPYGRKARRWQWASVGQGAECEGEGVAGRTTGKPGWAEAGP